MGTVCPFLIPQMVREEGRDRTRAQTETGGRAEEDDAAGSHRGGKGKTRGQGRGIGQNFRGRAAVCSKRRNNRRRFGRLEDTGMMQ